MKSRNKIAYVAGSILITIIVLLLALFAVGMENFDNFVIGISVVFSLYLISIAFKILTRDVTIHLLKSKIFNDFVKYNDDITLKVVMSSGGPVMKCQTFSFNGELEGSIYIKNGDDLFVDGEYKAILQKNGFHSLQLKKAF